MAKADLIKLEKEAMEKIKEGSPELRKFFSDYQAHIISVPTNVVKNETKLQMAEREAYNDFDGDMKASIIARFGDDKPWKELNRIIEREVPNFTHNMFDRLQKTKETKGTEWIIEWIQKNRDNYVVKVRKEKNGVPQEVYKSFKQTFKNKAQVNLISKLDVWCYKEIAGQSYSRRGMDLKPDKEGGELTRQQKAWNKKMGANVPRRGGGTQQAHRGFSRQGKPWKPRPGVTSRGTKHGDINLETGIREETWGIGEKGLDEDLPLSRANISLLDISHDEGSAVGGVRKVILGTFLDGWPGFMDGSGGGGMGSLVAANLREDGVQLLVESKTNVNGEMSHETHCSLEAASLQRKTFSKNEVDFLNKKFKEACLLATAQVTQAYNLGAFGKVGSAVALTELEGSDSFRTMVEKKEVEALVKPLRGQKGVKIRTRLKTQIQKNSRSTYRGKKRKPKVTIKKALFLRPKKAKPLQSTRSKKKSRAGPSNAPLFLLGILNKQLPQVVGANMGPPALTNQTGRFASSVRATDMIQTPQGFPSIGFTYQRDPYGTFEQDTSYDPRKLIDRSMREIAAEYAIGRFYTRRV